MLFISQSTLSIIKQFRDTLCTKWVTLFLLFAPARIASHYTSVNPRVSPIPSGDDPIDNPMIVVFVLNAVAIIRLAALLACGTENLPIILGRNGAGERDVWVIDPLR